VAGSLRGLLSLIVLAAMTCLAVRYVLPVVLKALIEPLRGVLGMIAALLVLPEFWISTASRRGGGGPPHFAYVYGNGVVRLALLGHRAVGVVLRSLARAARAAHPVAVAVVAVAWELNSRLG
jgi:hypothetical protein